MLIRTLPAVQRRRQFPDAPRRPRENFPARCRAPLLALMPELQIARQAWRRAGRHGLASARSLVFVPGLAWQGRIKRQENRNIARGRRVGRLDMPKARQVRSLGQAVTPQQRAGLVGRAACSKAP